MDSKTSSITLTVNGVKRQVAGNKFSLQTSLADFLRNELGQTGTKKLCCEGACGCCAVVASIYDNQKKVFDTKLINSCLQPIHACDGWHIITIEGLGNKKDGFHQLQKEIAACYGTQCGFCTPGFIMAVYSATAGKSKISDEEMAASLSGNLCRCTGYRPIVDFLADSVKKCNSAVWDIEDLGLKCQKSINLELDKKSVEVISCDEKSWYQPLSLEELFTTTDRLVRNKISYQLVAGNTANEIVKGRIGSDAYISLSSIPSLSQVSTDATTGGVSMGAGVTLTQMINVFDEMSGKAEYEYFKALRAHVMRIGTISIRNMSTWAGNLMYFKSFPEFPSDIYAFFTAINASLLIACDAIKTVKISMEEFISYDMNNKVLIGVELAAKTPSFVFWSYKAMPRASSALANVSSAFSGNLINNAFVGEPIIAFVGFNGKAFRCNSAEKVLKDQKLNKAVLQDVLKAIAGDLEKGAKDIKNFSGKQKLACNLFYKFWLHLFEKNLPKEIASGCADLKRSLPVGKQTYTPAGQEEAPYGQPMPKIDGAAQCSGEAKFVNDKASQHQQLFGAFVYTQHASANIAKIDPSHALAMPGVFKYISSDDVPGKNDYFFGRPLFNNDHSNYSGQIIGLVLADSQSRADGGAKAVKIEYSEQTKPILTPKEAFDANLLHGPVMGPFIVGSTEDGFKEAEVIFEGEIDQGGQAHSFIEPFVASANPTEEGIYAEASTQSVTDIQEAISHLTGLPRNRVLVRCDRTGGAFGGKSGTNCMTAAACGLAAYLTNRPVRMYVNFQDYMRISAKRTPVYAKYKVGVKKDGKITAIEMDYYIDKGYQGSLHMYFAIGVLHSADTGYGCPNWLVKAYVVKTNTPDNTFARAPGAVPPSLIMEVLMENISIRTGIDIHAVREANLCKTGQIQVHNPTEKLNDGDLMKVLWDKFKQSADWQARVKQVQQFNKDNRWKKRGLSVVPSRFPIGYWGMKYSVAISVYPDGSVELSHGGIEMGQGLNTKLAQLMCRELRAPIEVAKVRGSDTFVNANSSPTGGSVCPEIAGNAIMKACATLNEALKPFRGGGGGEGDKKGASWQEVIAKAAAGGACLTASGFHIGLPPDQVKYNVYSTMAAEVELDVLTGEFHITRCDILFDCGKSFNPALDVGQIEGAFVIGLGNWLFESIEYDRQTGRLLTDSTWTYHLPTALDIPEDFRVEIISNNSNPFGILSAKGMGEPPIMGSVAPFFAIKEAINSARADAKLKPAATTKSPLLINDIIDLCGTNIDQLVDSLPQNIDDVQLVHVYSSTT